MLTYHFTFIVTHSSDKEYFIIYEYDVFIFHLHATINTIFSIILLYINFLYV